MCNRNLLLSLIVGLGLAAPAAVPAPADDAAQAKKIAKLVEQLGSDSFEERQTAYQELDKIGEPALEALRKAAASKDAEVRKKAGDLAAKIEARIETRRILAPTTVHLKYDDTPLAEALADFGKKSGYVLVLHDPDNKTKGRKVTLDTGKTTFWKALEQFCDKAGLVEGDPNANFRPMPIRRPGLPVRPVAPGGAAPVPPAGGGGAAVPAAKPPRPIAVAFAVKAPPPAAVPALPPPGPPLPGGIAIGAPARRWVPVQLGQITLVDGKPKPEPTDSSSSVRVRAQPDNKMYPASSDKELVVVLQLTPEPRLQWRRTTGVKVNKAVDDNDQALAQAAENTAVPGGPGGVRVLPGRVVRPGVAIARPWYGSGMSHYVPARLTKGEKTTKSLKELSGLVSGEVLGPVEHLVVADDPFNAKGKTFKGKHGGSFQIESLEKDADGVITLRFKMETPGGTIMDTSATPPAAWQPKPGGGPIRRPPAVKGGPGVARPAIAFAPGRGRYFNYTGITLRDEKGNVLPAFVVIDFGKGGGFAPGGTTPRDYTLTYAPEKEHGKPAKLVYDGRRITSVHVPFTLKDVKLP